MKTDQTISFWLNAAGRLPLLPKVEVIRLANIIQDKESSDKIREKAISKIVSHNLRLIPSVVKSCTVSKRTFKFGDLNTEDLLQAGVIGLRRAAEKYNPGLGYAFSTYAANWIYQSIQREIYNNLSMIRIPETTIRQVYNSINETNSRSFADKKKNARHRMMSAYLAMEVMSLDSSMRDLCDDPDTCTNYYMFNPVQSEPGSYTLNEASDSYEDILKLVDLDETQKLILYKYFHEEPNLAQIAREIGMSAYSVRNSFANAMASLRSAVSQ